VNRRSESERGGKSLRDRFRESTNEAILLAAEEVFADAGLHAARMEDIATRAGVSVGTLYNHFADRDALVRGLMQARRASLLAALDAAVAGAPDASFRGRLRGTLVAFLDHCERHHKFLRIVLQQEVHGTVGKSSGDKTDAMRELDARLERLMKQGLREKVLRPETADLAATLLLGMMRGLVIRSVVLGKSPALVAEADRLLEAFLGGLGGGGA
jgi:AcrR family transcriptional regulator